MKRGTPGHPKVSHLAEILEIPLYGAVGILEMLWQFAARYAPRGDIGKYPNSMIAKNLAWEDDAEMLIHGLIEARWIEEDGEARLGIHDWHDHSDQACDKYLVYHGLVYWNGAPPRGTTGRKSRRVERFSGDSLEKPGDSLEKPGNSLEKSAKDRHRRTSPEKSGESLENLQISLASHTQSHTHTHNTPCSPPGGDGEGEAELSEGSSGEGDEAHRVFAGSVQLRGMTYEQDLRVRRDFGAAPGKIPWKEMAAEAVEEAELWSEPIRNPALFWRKRVQGYVDKNFGKEEASEVRETYKPMGERGEDASRRGAERKKGGG